MSWALRLTVWWMNFATELAHLMLRCGALVYRDDLRPPIVRILNKNGSIVRTSPVVIPSLWPPLVLQPMSTERPSITWLLLQSTRGMSDLHGLTGAASGEDQQMWCILSFQEPARGPLPEAGISFQI